MMSSDPSTPPLSRDPSTNRKIIREDLTLDLSDLPGLVSPAPPSNTLLITNLQDEAIFAPTSLAHIRELINKHTADDVYTFSPLRSFRRIIITFYSIESAITVRALLDGETVFTSRIRIYFGEPTPISPDNDRTKHLAAPKADKQFFISPPPSPPHGWESKDEGPPNKDVHAEDLVVALQRLTARSQNPAAAIQSNPANTSRDETDVRDGRKRSGSMIVFDPLESGNSPDLPAIAVEDTTDSPEPMTPVDREQFSIAMPKTERPPVDLAFGR